MFRYMFALRAIYEKIRLPEIPTSTHLIQNRQFCAGLAESPAPQSVRPEIIPPTYIVKKLRNKAKCDYHELNNKLAQISTLLDSNSYQAQRLFNLPDVRDNIQNIDAVCEVLHKEGITNTVILEHPFVLGQSVKQLSTKIALLKLQQPRDINDFVPLIRASASRLNKIRKIFRAETSSLPGHHRIYYLADRLRIDPRVVATHVSTHLFMLDMDLDQLIENLEIQIKYNVAPINILRDPWAFRYSSKAIDGRLGRAVDGYKDKLMPWMVRCPETILAKSIQHSMDEKELLGDGTLVDYVAKRLGYDVPTTKFILDKHPAIHRVRVTKIKEILDFFLNESEFSASDIAQVPRVLCHSLETTRARLDELRSFGCKPSSLVIICRSANEYRKFKETWINTRDKQESRKKSTNTRSSATAAPVDQP